LGVKIVRFLRTSSRIVARYTAFSFGRSSRLSIASPRPEKLGTVGFPLQSLALSLSVFSTNNLVHHMAVVVNNIPVFCFVVSGIAPNFTFQ
jgi:hypothetical protein